MHKRLHSPSHYSSNSYQLTGLLREHQGCINTLEWSEDGEWLLSGSDDTQIVLWDIGKRRTYQAQSDEDNILPGNGRRALRSGNAAHVAIPTGHTQNIFDAKFAPKRMDRIVTASGDGQVRIIERWLHGGTPTITAKQSSARDRAKRLEFVTDGPDVFMVCNEDGTLQQFDLRDGKRNKLLDFSNDQLCLYSLSICPSDRNLLAIGASDPFVRFYDTRKLTASTPLSYWCASSQHRRPSPHPHSSSDFIAAVRFSRFSYDLAVSVMHDAAYIINPKYQNEGVLRAALPQLASDFSFELDGWQGIQELAAKDSYEAAETQWRQLAAKHRSLASNELWSSIVSRELYNAALCRAKVSKKPTSSMLRDLELAEDLDGSFAAVKYLKAMALLLSGSLEACIEYCDATVAAKQTESAFDPEILEKLRHVSSLAKVCSLDPAQLSHIVPETMRNVARDITPSDLSQSIPFQRLQAGEQPIFFNGYIGCGRGPVLDMTIKNIGFAGDRDQYLATGSDSGYAFLFPNPSELPAAKFSALEPVFMAKSDDSVVNVIESHPTRPLLAMSGIDDTVKLWEPRSIAQDAVDDEHSPWIPDEDIKKRFHPLPQSRIEETIRTIPRSQAEPVFRGFEAAGGGVVFVLYH